MLDNES